MAFSSMETRRRNPRESNPSSPQEMLKNDWLLGADSSPNRRTPGVKHPLVSKKSPIFTKFGMENLSESNEVFRPSTGTDVIRPSNMYFQKKEVNIHENFYAIQPGSFGKLLNPSELNSIINRATNKRSPFNDPRDFAKSGHRTATAGVTRNRINNQSILDSNFTEMSMLESSDASGVQMTESSFRSVNNNPKTTSIKGRRLFVKANTIQNINQKPQSMQMQDRKNIPSLQIKGLPVFPDLPAMDGALSKGEAQTFRPDQLRDSQFDKFNSHAITVIDESDLVEKSPISINNNKYATEQSGTTNDSKIVADSLRFLEISGIANTTETYNKNDLSSDRIRKDESLSKNFEVSNEKDHDFDLFEFKDQLLVFKKATEAKEIVTQEDNLRKLGPAQKLIGNEQVDSHLLPSTEKENSSSLAEGYNIGLYKTPPKQPGMQLGRLSEPARTRNHKQEFHFADKPDRIASIKGTSIDSDRTPISRNSNQLPNSEKNNSQEKSFRFKSPPIRFPSHQRKPQSRQFQDEENDWKLSDLYLPPKPNTSQTRSRSHSRERVTNYYRISIGKGHSFRGRLLMDDSQNQGNLTSNEIYANKDSSLLDYSTETGNNLSRLHDIGSPPYGRRANPTDMNEISKLKEKIKQLIVIFIKFL